MAPPAVSPSVRDVLRNMNADCADFAVFAEVLCNLLQVFSDPTGGGAYPLPGTRGFLITRLASTRIAMTMGSGCYLFDLTISSSRRSSAAIVFALDSMSCDRSRTSAGGSLPRVAPTMIECARISERWFTVWRGVSGTDGG